MAAVTRALGVLLLWPALTFAQPAPPATVSASLSSTTCPGTGCVTLNVSSYASVGVQVTGTWVGTLTFQASNDGVTYQTLNATATNGTSPVTTTTANGLWSSSAAGLKYVQVVFTAYTSGTAVVTLQAALAGGGSGGGGSGGSDVTVHDPVVTTQKANVNASGQLSVNCANCSGSGVSQQDNTGFTPGTTNMVPIGAEVDDVATTAATENNAAAVRMDTNRSLYVQLRSGAAQTGTSGSPVRTDPTGTTTQPETPKDSGGTSMTDTTAHALKVLSVDATGTVIAPTTLATHDGALTPAATTGGLSMYRASSSAPSAVSTNDDAVLPWADLTGRLHVTGDSAMTALKVDGSAVTQPVSGTVTTTPPINATTNVTQYASTNVVSAGVAGLFAVGGAAASGATKSGNPLQIGGVFNTTQPTVTTGQAVEAQATARGELLIAKGVSGFSIDNTAFTANAGTNLNTSALALSATQTDRTQKTQLTDGTRDGTIKAASTAAAAGDTSYVVALSPNSALPTGANTIGGVNLTQYTPVSGRLPVDGSGVTQPVSGAVTANQGGTWTVQPGNTANTTAWKVDGSAVTQPVSGTIACSNCGAGQTDNAAFTGGSSGVTTGALLYNEAPPAVSSGSVGAARMNAYRITDVVQTDPQGNPDVSNQRLLQQLIALTAAVQANTGKFAVPNSFYAAAGAPVRLNAPIVTPDPCSGLKSNLAISQTTSTKVFAGQPGRKVYVCSIFIVGADAENLSLAEGTGATCGTNTVAIIGGTTAANGPNFAANGGWQQGGAGNSVAAMNLLGNDLCLLQSGAGRVAGNLTYVLQ